MRSWRVRVEETEGGGGGDRGWVRARLEKEDGDGGQMRWQG